MNILVLGGTHFVGRDVVNEALSRGHQVTVFNRGNKAVPPGVTQLIGDRLKPDGLDSLKGKTFDAVVDTWMSKSIAVKHAIEVLRGNVGHYTYVSSISVYNPRNLGEDEDLDENTPLVDITQPGTHPYLVDKRSCELVLLDEGPDFPLFIPRPGLILGPREGPMRLPWWLWRMERGGRTLAPGPKDLELRYVDSRDLAIFILDGIEKKRVGFYNAVSNPAATTMGELLEIANATAGGKAELIWKDSEAIKKAGIQGWMELPIWLPAGTKEYRFTYAGNYSKAYDAGLRVRSAAETIKDTWAWMKSGDDVPSPDSLDVGVPPEKEAAILEPDGAL